MREAGDSTTRLKWLDAVKAIALFGIFLNHVVERSIGYPLIANPSAHWPPFERRLVQLLPFSGYGMWDLPYNLLRYLGFAGEIGVQLFLTASGFGLTLSLLRRQSDELRYGAFIRRRAGRIYPTWWIVHFLALLASIPVLVFIGGSASEQVAAPWDPRFYLSLLGLRVTPDSLYYLVPAWWFIALLLQLYLVFPFLYKLLKRVGPAKLLLYGVAVSWIVRGMGLLVFDEYLDAWSRGAIFITRLPEFLLGISLASWFHSDPQTADRRLASPAMILGGSMAIAVGTASALTLIGNTWSPFLLGAGWLVILYALFRDRDLESPLGSVLRWISVHSYSLYLVHHPIAYALSPPKLGNALWLWGGIFAALLMTAIAGLLLERVSDHIIAAIGKTRQRGLLPRRLLQVGTVTGVAWLALIVGSETVRDKDPQEVLGWGERPALESHEVFGWLLKPSRETRLRWLGYDYVVASNAIGFPTDQPGSPSPGALRVLVVGDAFSSAEGVDTELAWPRLLERSSPGGDDAARFDVFNFAMTGFNSRQYSAVVAEFSPLVRPDVILLQMYLNDFGVSPDSWARDWEAIGFGKPDPDGLYARIQFPHLAKYLRSRVTEPLLESFFGIPSRSGYWLAGISYLERDRLQPGSRGLEETEHWLASIRSSAGGVGAEVVMVLVPAPAQVCSRQDLSYFPSTVDLSDSTKFDLDRPQRVGADLARKYGFRFVDLIETLSREPDCPYHRQNLHWTREGHLAVARRLAAELRDSWVGERDSEGAARSTDQP